MEIPTQQRRRTSAWRQAALLVFIPILAAASLFGVRAALRSDSDAEQYASYQSSPASSAAAIAPLTPKNQDSDHDGLPDWQETVYKTDPTRSDTDGDGMADGDEVRQGRDPLALAALDIAAAELSEPEPSYGENLTNRFAADLGSALLPSIGGLAQTGTLNDEDAARIAAALPNFDASQLLGKVPTVTERDLVRAPSADIAAVKKYFNDIYLIYEKHLVSLPTDDLVILVIALQSNDFAQLAQIDRVAAALHKSFDEVKALAVPAGQESFAVKELNYLLRTESIVKVLRHADQDPLAAMVAVQSRVDLIKEVRAFHLEMGKTLAKIGVTFQPDEEGYIYLN